MSISLTRRLIEAEIPEFTNKMAQNLFPAFVKGDSPDEDHKCGTCSMRIEPDGCTHVEGKISMSRGTCLMWVKGPASRPEDSAEVKLTQKTAGYVEADKVNCSTCRSYKDDMCKTFDAKVGHGDCCLVWEGKKGVER